MLKKALQVQVDAIQTLLDQQDALPGRAYFSR
jgi:hypothetical protein